MSSNPQLIYQLDSALIQNFLLAAPFALYAYDRLITFDREVDLIWGRPSQRRIPIVPILYVLMHVSTPLYFVINIATWWDLDCKSVYALNLAYGADTCVMYLTWGAISALRVYAINPRDWSVPIMVFALSLVPVATNLHRNILMIWEVLPPSYTCTITNNVPARVQSIFEIATRVSTVVGDALVLLATWRVTYGVKRMSHLTKSDIPLTLLLLRDGTLYFGSLLVLNIFSAVCWAKIPAIQDFDNFIYSFTTLLLSRLFFNLREVSLLQSTLRADQASGDADMHTLSWEPAERAGVSQGPSALQFWSYSTAFGSLGGSLAFTDEEQAASTTTKEKNAGMPRDFADYDGTSNSDSSPALASGKDEEGASGDVEMAVLETWPS